MVPASSFFPQRSLSLNTLSLGHSWRWATNLPTVCLSTFQIAVCPQTVYPAFSPNASPVSFELSQNHAYWPLELQALSLPGFRDARNWGPLAFQTNPMRIHYLCIPLYFSLSFPLLWDCDFLPTALAMIHFSPKPRHSTLPTVFDVSSVLFSTLNCGAFSAILHVDFWVI